VGDGHLQKLITNFYSLPESVQNGIITIEGEEAKHISKVLRYKIGDMLSVVDGCGVRYKVVLEQIKRDYVLGRVVNQVRRENETVVNLTLACGLSTGSKMDLVIEKCTELGVRKFIPVLTQQGMVEIDEPAKIKKKLARWNKVAIAAMKQSLRCYLPKIEEPVSLSELALKTIDYDRSLIASLEPEAKSLKDSLLSEEPFKDILLLVGPEAGFSEEELELCREKRFAAVRLGPRRLRTETACVLFCGLVLGYLGELE
jgi:16S rRNA (uracil1498-N3)-methyltransferase